jgi:arylsulfatase A-like enzyme/tetratricopeptide (TPR) repeat protein
MSRLGKARLAALAVALVALTAAAGAAPKRGARSAAAGAHGDVVLITLDTLRADAPGFAGNRRSSTPVLDRLAAQGRVFTFAHAHNVVTLPSHTNILTGLYPYQHGVRENLGFRLPPTVATVATLLRGAGYATGAFVGAFPLDSQFGLDRGFEVYDDRYPKGADDVEFSMPERRGDEVMARALAWWRQKKGRPRFLWVHLYDPHAPYAPPEPFAARFRDNLYLGEVAATDSFLAPLLGPFLDAPLGGSERPALVVVTADHGEAMGEHGERTHGLFAYEATLHVPLVLWGRRVIPGKDGRSVRHVDLLPTILDAAGVTLPAAGRARYPGRSLLAAPPAQSAKTGDDSYFESLSAALNRGWAPLRGVLHGERKYISLPLPEVYEPRRDPGEEKNLYSATRAAADSAFAALPRESAWPPPRTGVSPEVEAQLRSLGYAGGAGGEGSAAAHRTAFGAEDDPKNLVALDGKINEVIDLYSRRQLDAAIAKAREVVAARSGMPLGHSLLVQALLERGERGDRDEALAAMRRARAQGAVSDALLRQMGLTLAETGRTDEAIAILRPLAERAGAGGDLEARNAYALALSEAGRQEEAEAVLQRVLAVDPENAKAHEQRALVALRRGQLGAACDAARRAIELNRRLPLAWNNLGVALFQLGQVDGALDAWQSAVDLKPDLWDALWNLGTKAAERGRAGQARQALARFAAGAPPSYAKDVAEARALLQKLGG